ncbi:hypothetical protein TPADAL_0140a [Treponema pallidum subsp. pallidum DAL-1]|uniref:Uncharacterized protein n=2 Tax=Treponema pallidum TaxID=160 RepID=A0AAU8S8K9_TREPL|nr:pyrazinamidase/nicotinamidase [Treponema pallidum subsp. pallidum str. Chicago]AEZ57266.1 hypothetical protein TPESAMD_0140a [Treponema pallidum subsp. pertenue str. SamoaD]AEZ58335.1 hypothetical protein TPECDC2_0140a [Treponema pallidum subsp. pertenue str. CDC2]AEZ59403.1 hypothetical protein TPEGAU_0140a [Treponema pallidum subsp. pertenue str. Gauthier]AEZ60467.1 hypothetical protein TPADAL_0140a [Treponema pallidum subsp. pallidum DAL-1]AGK83791.1 hypothetical protein TPFB_0140a [Trep
MHRHCLSLSPSTNTDILVFQRKTTSDLYDLCVLIVFVYAYELARAPSLYRQRLELS